MTEETVRIYRAADPANRRWKTIDVRRDAVEITFSDDEEDLASLAATIVLLGLIAQTQNTSLRLTEITPIPLNEIPGHLSQKTIPANSPFYGGEGFRVETTGEGFYLIIPLEASRVVGLWYEEWETLQQPLP